MSKDLKHRALLVRIWQRVESGTYLIMRGASAQDALALMPFSDRHISSINMIRNRASLPDQCFNIGQISCLASRIHNPIVVSIYVHIRSNAKYYSAATATEARPAAEPTSSANAAAIQLPSEGRAIPSTVAVDRVASLL